MEKFIMKIYHKYKDHNKKIVILKTLLKKYFVQRP